MDLKEINSFIDQEIVKLDKYYNSKNERELTLACAIKIGEETGELFNEVLAHKGFQRRDKLEKLDNKEIENEIADVIFTVMILARRFNIDIEQAINNKIVKMKSRSYD